MPRSGAWNIHRCELCGYCQDDDDVIGDDSSSSATASFLVPLLL